MRCKFFLIIMVCLGFFLEAKAQDTFVLKGVISRNISVERLAQVLITNLRTKNIMMSDELGWFSISAAIGDTLLFNKTNYTDLKIVIKQKEDMPVYMQPVIVLDQVTING